MKHRTDLTQGSAKWRASERRPAVRRHRCASASGWTADRGELSPVERVDFEGSTEADDDPTAERDQAHKLKIGQRGDDCNGRAELGAEGGDECGVGDGFSGDGLRGAGEPEAAAGEGIGGGGLRFREEHAGAGILAEVPRVGGEAADEDHERPVIV